MTWLVGPMLSEDEDRRLWPFYRPGVPFPRDVDAAQLRAGLAHDFSPPSWRPWIGKRR